MEEFNERTTYREVLAGSGESAEDAENPEGGKPPVLSLKIQGGKSITDGELEPRKAGGCWARGTILEGGPFHPRFYSHCFIPPRLKRESAGKETPQLLSPRL